MPSGSALLSTSRSAAAAAAIWVAALFWAVVEVPACEYAVAARRAPTCGWLRWWWSSW